MGVNVQMKIENLDKLTSLAERYPAIAEKHIGEAIVKGISEIQREAQPLVPVATRRLWGELQIPHFARFEGWFGSNVDYGKYVHGYENQAGLRFKNPSLNKNAVRGFLTIAVKSAGKRVNDFFNTALEKITKELGD